MRQFKLHLIYAMVLLGFSSCIKIEDVEIKEIRSVKLLEYSEEGLTVESEIQINNPNSYDIEVTQSEFKVQVNEYAIGDAKIISDLKIPESSSDFHTVKLRSSHKDLKSTAIPHLIAITASGKDKLDFKVDGFIEGKVWFFKRKVDVAYEGEVDLELF
ncbi:MAG: hypothetical protein CMP59_09340 [Flavobacteriales bacterium]|nr:hypothetical protein [Flavobacteriales bacterium]|tara:strand:- start:632 stop:1105 length:474 start_codon:yes stop_codon:yes gene_type:complete